MTYIEIENFIKDIVKEHGNLIQNNQWDELYKNIDHLSPIIVGGFTQILLDSGINPLLYMKEVPYGFLNNADLTNSSYLIDNKPGYFTIPDNIEVINDKAFCNVKGLTDLAIPPSIKKINRYAFHKDQKINLHITDFTSFMSIDFDHAINPVLVKDGNVKVFMYGADVASSITTRIDNVVTRINPIRNNSWIQISKRYNNSNDTIANKSYIDAHQHIMNIKDIASCDKIGYTQGNINGIKVRD